MVAMSQAARVRWDALSLFTLRVWIVWNLIACESDWSVGMPVNERARISPLSALPRLDGFCICFHRLSDVRSFGRT